MVLVAGCKVDTGGSDSPLDGEVRGDARAPADGAVGGDDIQPRPDAGGGEADLDRPRPEDAGPDGPEAPADDCALGCEALDACGRCVEGDAGGCLSVDECADACRGEPAGEARSLCLLGLDSCEDELVDACLEAASMGDACDLGCGSLDACGWCLPGEDDECLDPAGCAEECRAAGGALGPCLEDAACDEDAIDACLAGEADVCLEGCASLDACGWCVEGEDDECLDVAGCAERCRADGGALGGCLVEAECDDDAVDACLADPDGCMRLCEALDVCEACLPEDDGCAADCAEACSARDDVDAVLDCVEGAEMCDVAGCFEPPADDCEAGCASLDGCGWCVTDEDDECLDVAGCARSCRDNGGALGPCLLDAACDPDAVDACLEGPPDTCRVLCLALNACASCFQDGNECAANCLAACGEHPDPEGLLACVEDAEMCVVEGCFPPPPDPCVDGCVAYDACELCFVDENDECLPPEDCAARCRANGEQAQLGCVAAVAGCDEDALDACLEDEVPPPADDCEAGCRSIEVCGWCINADDECLDLPACAARCREVDGFGACLVAAGCDGPAVDVCFERLAPDVCEQLCDALDACEACVPDGDGCAADCRAACEGLGDAEDLLGCVEGAEMCDLAACFGGPPPPDPCLAGCAHYDACEFCFLDANDECLSVEGCAADCRVNGEEALLSCIADVADCDGDALDECLLVEPNCADACVAILECDPPEGDLAEARAACEVDCEDNPDGYDLACIRDAARCRGVRDCSP